MAGALPLSNNAEGGTNGTTVTTGNSGGASGDAWDAVFIEVGDTLVYDSGQAAHGSLSYKGTNLNNAMNLDWTPASAFSEIYGRTNIRKSVATDTQEFLVIFNVSSQLNAIIRINNAGKLECESYDGVTSASTGVKTGSKVISADSWFRVDWHVTISATIGKVEAGLVLSPDGQSVDEWVSQNGNTGAGTAVTTRFGNRSSGAASNWWLDDIRVATGDFPGPVADLPAGLPPAQSRVPMPMMAVPDQDMIMRVNQRSY